jgi:hypothetical protein
MARQVEMARILGMNPNKLPGLRPTPQQRWKLPVGEFIEERYYKRFGSDRLDRQPSAESSSRTPALPPRDAHAPERVRRADWQVGDLVCYLTNLADDLQKWHAHGEVDREILPQVSEELREIAKAVDNGAPISPVAAIPLPPRPAHRTLSRQHDQESAFDDEIPF